MKDIILILSDHPSNKATIEEYIKEKGKTMDDLIIVEPNMKVDELTRMLLEGGHNASVVNKIARHITVLDEDGNKIEPLIEEARRFPFELKSMPPLIKPYIDDKKDVGPIGAIAKRRKW